MSPKSPDPIPKMQGCIDQLYVIATRIDARLEVLSEMFEDHLDEPESSRFVDLIRKNEFSRMEGFLVAVEILDCPETAKRMRAIFNHLMKMEGKA